MDDYTRTGRSDLIACLQAYDAAVERIRTRLENCKRTAEAHLVRHAADGDAPMARVQTYELVLAELEQRPI